MAEPIPTTMADSPAARTGRAPSPWRWTIAACVLLGLAGASRSRSSDRYAGVRPEDIRPPFALKDIAKDLGDWAVVAESDKLLDPKIVQIAGCSDYLVRSYYYKPTGVSVTALVIYGPSHLVVPHTPEVCYPATGYVRFGGPSSHPVPSGPASAQFRSLVYGLPSGGAAAPRLAVVYYSYRVNDRWLPVIPDREAFSRNTPPVFKVQIQRRVTASEKLDDHNPTEEFLGPLLKDIEDRVKAARG